MKLLRMPRLQQLLNVEKFKNIVNNYFKKQLEDNIKNMREEPYPTLKAINLVQSYQIL